MNDRDSNDVITSNRKDLRRIKLAEMVERAFQEKKKKIVELVKDHYQNNNNTPINEKSRTEVELSTFFNELRAIDCCSTTFMIITWSKSMLYIARRGWHEGHSIRFGFRSQLLSCQITPHLISLLAITSVRVRHLSIVSDGSDCLDIEDVFEAFAKVKFSSWRTKKLTKIVVQCSDLNSPRRGDTFHLEEDEYPEGLREILIEPFDNQKYRCYEISATIFRVVSRSSRLHRFCIDTNWDGTIYTPVAVDVLCDILNERIVPLYDTRMLSNGVLRKLSEQDFDKLLKVVTRNRKVHYSHPVIPQSENERTLKVQLNFILNKRREVLDFHLKLNKCIDVVLQSSNNKSQIPAVEGNAPFILEISQSLLIDSIVKDYSTLDLLYAILQHLVPVLVTHEIKEN